MQSANRFGRGFTLLVLSAGFTMLTVTSTALLAPPSSYLYALILERTPIQWVMVFFGYLGLFDLSERAWHVRIELVWSAKAREIVSHVSGAPPARIDSVVAAEIETRLAASLPDQGVARKALAATLARYRQTGYVVNADDALGQQLELTRASSRAREALVRTVVWILPITGFIGTVVGLSGAVRALGVLDRPMAAETYGDVVGQVLVSLGIAFDTTVLGLVLCVIVALPAAAVWVAEERTLTRVATWCSTEVLDRLVEQPREEATAELVACARDIHELLVVRLRPAPASD